MDRKEYHRMYYQAHKDEARARHRKAYAKWYEAHREERLAYFREYYATRKGRTICPVCLRGTTDPDGMHQACKENR